MIQINASTRLSAAKANAGQARKYLESLGVEVGALDNSRPGTISFDISDANAAVKAIKSALKKVRPIEEKWPSGARRWRFQIAPGRFVVVTKDKSYALVYILDKALMV